MGVEVEVGTVLLGQAQRHLNRKFLVDCSRVEEEEQEEAQSVVSRGTFLLFAYSSCKLEK